VRPALAIDQDVRRLQVAVQDAALVRVMDRPGDPRHQPGRGAGIGDEFCEPIGQARPSTVAW
jgi:hypothetical protein